MGAHCCINLSEWQRSEKKPNPKITDYGRLQLATPLNFESCLRSLEILWKIF